MQILHQQCHFCFDGNKNLIIFCFFSFFFNFAFIGEIIQTKIANYGKKIFFRLHPSVHLYVSAQYQRQCCSHELWFQRRRY